MQNELLPLILKPVLFAAAALAMLGTVISATPARADSFFIGLDGNWRGSGFIRATSNSPEENIRCRLFTSIGAAKKRLNINGNCSIAGLILPVQGSIVAQRSAYEANLFRNLVRVSTSSFSGQRRGSNLRLRYVGVDAVTKQKIETPS